jgi:hypothetical protein
MLLLSVFLSVSSFAGSGLPAELLTEDYGKAVKCATTVITAERYESQLLGHDFPNLIGATLEQKLDVLLVANIEPYSAAARDYFRQLILDEMSKVAFVPATEFSLVGPNLPIALPNGCEWKQLALRVFEEDGRAERKIINQDLWAAMSDEDKLVTYFKFAIGSIDVTPDFVRRLLSNRFSLMTPNQIGEDFERFNLHSEINLAGLKVSYDAGHQQFSILDYIITTNLGIFPVLGKQVYFGNSSYTHMDDIASTTLSIQGKQVSSAPGQVFFYASKEVCALPLMSAHILQGSDGQYYSVGGPKNKDYFMYVALTKDQKVAVENGSPVWNPIYYCRLNH